MPERVGADTVFRQFVVKIASRCDLACDHCYVYEHADQSWRSRPRFPGADVLDRVAARIAEHCAAHVLPAVSVVLHGGEPLLAGVEAIRSFARGLRAALPAHCAADIRIQTNGIRLDDAFCRMFVEEGIGVGVSIDGDRSANDRHRRFADGRGSYAQLERAIRLLASDEYRSVFKGLLCTVDPLNDPVAVYDALAAFGPPRIEFLLPHATWAEPPAAAGSGPAPYARWLLAVHRRWSEGGRPMDVRMFTSITELSAGRASHTEALGLEPADIVVIETDGAIEQADSLKTAFDGAPDTGFDVFRHSFDEAGRHPGFADRRQGVEALALACRQCPVVRVCGGGLYAHRYDGKGFGNPSVYCEDLYTLITSLSGESERSAPHVPAPARRHGLDAAEFDGLARGNGSPQAMAVLRAAQLSRARLGLVRAAKQCSTHPAWLLIQETDRTRRDILNRVLGHPFLDIAAGSAESVEGALVKIALSCALLTGGTAQFEMATPAAGVIALPGVGVVDTGIVAGRVRIGVGVAGDRTLIEVDGRPATPMHDMAALGPIPILLESRDPARDRYGHPISGPLSEPEVARWRAELDAAARVLADRHPETLEAMAAGLTAIIPLKPEPGIHRSATARIAFGALGIALPDPADDEPGEALAGLLLHEFQHLKLGAVLDMFELHDGSDRSGYRVGWRPDPRSLEAVIHGVYAHLAVVEYWRRRAVSEPADDSPGEYPDTRSAEHSDQRRNLRAESALRAATWADHVRDALGGIAGSPALTPLGQRWIQAASDTASAWSPIPQTSDTLGAEGSMPPGEGGASGRGRPQAEIPVSRLLQLRPREGR